MEYLKIEKADNILIIIIDCPNSSVNKFSSALLDEFSSIIDDIENDSKIRGIVITSAKKDNFFAGADLYEIKNMAKTEEVRQYISKSNELLNRIASLRTPVVCAINGNCVGGGLELALVANYRIASDSTKTIFSLPEVKLGLLPAAGGAHRLPRLIGLPEALPFMLTGKQIRIKEAKALGLIDEIVSPYNMKEIAVKNAILLSKKKIKKTPVKRLTFNKLTETIPALRKYFFKQAEKQILQKTNGLYPAPLIIIESVRYGWKHGTAIGIYKDIDRFAKLALSDESKALVNQFFAVNQKKKNPFLSQNKPVKKIGIVGAGLMGQAIAGISTFITDLILLKDLSIEKASKGISEIIKKININYESGALTKFEKDTQIAKLVPCDNFTGFKNTDMVIETAFENLELKKSILKHVENSAGKETIFASNTSAIPISLIAEACKYPENVIGTHYFSPAARMPLLEIIVTDKTSNKVTSTVIDFGIKQGKTCIVVKDSPGFYTTRIIAMMINEALLLIEEGVNIHTIDTAMKKFGYPIGPIKLLDEVGLDVGVDVGEILKDLIKKRNIQVSNILSKLYGKGFLGRKNKKGFYSYNTPGPLSKRPLNYEANKILGIKKRSKIALEELQNRVSLMMINEAVICLEQGIIQSPEDGDIGAVLSFGFPSFIGGPFRYIDKKGPEKILSIMANLQKKYGDKFKPADMIIEMAKSNKKFY